MQQTRVSKVTKDNSKSRPKYIPITPIISYAEQGLTHAEIGKLLGCSAPAITQRLGRIGYTPSSRKAFEHDKAMVYEAVQMQIVDNLTLCDWKKTSPAQQVTALAILEDKIRLIRGQSTANVSSWSHVLQGIEAKGSAKKPTSSAVPAPKILDTIPASETSDEPDEAP